MFCTSALTVWQHSVVFPQPRRCPSWGCWGTQSSSPVRSREETTVGWRAPRGHTIHTRQTTHRRLTTISRQRTHSRHTRRSLRRHIMKRLCSYCGTEDPKINRFTGKPRICKSAINVNYNCYILTISE